ncbi:hypothetical protein ACN47E_005967 [Coniothyrium glycines]
MTQLDCHRERFSAIAPKSGVNTWSDLPQEIRDNIYAQMSPLRNDVHLFTGFLSIDLIKQEAQAEIIRTMKLCLESVQKKWIATYKVPLDVALPTTLEDVQQIHIQIPKSLVQPLLSVEHFPLALVPLLKCHVSLLSISFYEDEDNEGKTAAQASKVDIAYELGVISLMDCICYALENPILVCLGGKLQYYEKIALDTDVDEVTEASTEGEIANVYYGLVSRIEVHVDDQWQKMSLARSPCGAYIMGV